MQDLISRQDAIDAIKSYWKAEVDAIPKDADFGTITATCDLILKCNAAICKVLQDLPSAQPEPQWIPCERELPSNNREVEVTCKVRRLDGKTYEYTCHASYVHRYSIESTDYCNWEECDEYNEEEDKYYALPGWYERVHNWDEYSYCAIEDFVIAWRELPEPWRGEEHGRNDTGT